MTSLSLSFTFMEHNPKSRRSFGPALHLIQEFFLYHLLKEEREGKRKEREIAMEFVKSEELGLNPGSGSFNSYDTFDFRQNTNHLNLGCTCKHSGTK